MHRRLCAATTVFLLLVVSVAQAGIGPENVIVVVNADSQVSRTVANHYVQLRQIPSINVVMLSDIPKGLKISLADFKSKILNPLLAELNARRIAPQARVIAYSADFPTAVDVKEHAKKITAPDIKKFQSPLASINGATFFYQFMLSDRSEYLSWGANMYARGKFERHFANPFTGDVRDKFAAADKDFAEQRYDDAGVKFSELFEMYPSMSPLALRAAEAFAKAENREKAVEMIRAAIGVGWWSAEYLKDNETLATLLDDPAIEKTLPLLDSSPTTIQGPVGFAGDRTWTASGHWLKADKGGVPYLLSCSLAIVHENGSTLDQAISVLQRAATADRTHPRAEFRFGANQDVRAQTRFPNVGTALLYLVDAGHKTSVFRSNLPAKAGDVVGLMVGRATVDLSRQPWRLVPGAIAENLTSYGGVFERPGQTKLTEFLHAGAAMSSGTVAEPYSLQFKFPLPMMYGFYADGMSAIESFYLSVSSPYQLLIVGDPMCQPFAKPPSDWIDITLTDDKSPKVLLQRLSLPVKVPKTRARAVELYLADRLVRVSAPAKTINVDLPKGASGVLDVRAVLVGHDPTEPRISFSRHLDLNGLRATPTGTIDPSHSDDATTLKFDLICQGADSIELLHMHQPIASVDGGSGSVSVDTAPLGDGPLRFRTKAHFGETTVLGMPIVVRNRYSAERIDHEKTP